MKETNLSIEQKVKLKPIAEIASRFGLIPQDYEPFGHHKAKLPLSLINSEKISTGKLILVTAMTPTPKGEGKTTMSVGLNEALNALGKKSIVALREPSLGPVFGIKGGATGGGHSQVLPMEDINLHFNGDFSAIEKANNLLSALIDNFIQNSQSDPEFLPRINPSTVAWKRVIDVNDRFLRKIVTGLGGQNSGVPSESGFNITAASEIMAILCLSESIDELKKRIGNIYVGDTFDGQAIFARDLNAQGAMTLLLKDAIKPNMVQTSEGNTAIIHGGPFANIAHGCSSVIGTKMAMSLSDFTVTEAGFGADLGAEKFVNIKCQYGDLSPNAILLVATVKAVKYHGEEQGAGEHLGDLKAGFANLKRHIQNLKKFKVPLVIAINQFSEDRREELELLQALCEECGEKAFICDVWRKGSQGAIDLAAFVSEIANHQERVKPSYDWSIGIEEKIERVATQIYGASQVHYTPEAQKKLNKIKSLKLEKLPICIAKTPASFSENPKCLNAPEGFILTIRDFEFASGAGFIVPMAGNMLRMPGLPKRPAAFNMDIDNEGNMTGLN